MANVENPYETNLSNNLVVTSHVDEPTVKSDYYLDLYSYYGDRELMFSIPFRTYKTFYRDSPLEQTATISHGNPDPEKYAGMFVTDTTEDILKEYQYFKIRKKSDNSVLDLSKATATTDFFILVNDFFDGNIKYDFNLNNQTGWNLFVEYNADIDEETGVYSPGADISSSPDSSIEEIKLTLSEIFCITNIDNHIYTPILISRTKPEKNISNKPDGWHKISPLIYNIENFNMYVYVDYPNSYNIIKQSIELSNAISNVCLYINNILGTDEFDIDTLISLSEKMNYYANIQKYTNTEGEYIDIDINDPKAGRHIRTSLYDPNTEFYRTLITDFYRMNFGATGIYLDRPEDDPTAGMISQSEGTAVHRLTSPELEYPLNILIESSYCFADNSMVSTDRGLVAMKDLTLDHNVKCWDFDNGCITYAKPLFIQTHGKVSRSFEAVFDDGTICKYSKPHRCYCVDTRLFESLSYARNIGKSFYFEDGSIKKLVEWRVVDEPTTVYTMLTDHHMTSFVDGILAGSNMVMIYFIDKDMKYYKKPERKGNRPNNFGIPDKIFRGLRLYESPIPKGIIMRWLKREFISF